MSSAATISAWLLGLAWSTGATGAGQVTNICPSRRGGLSQLGNWRKLSCVDLHQPGREDVQRILRAYGPWLSRFRGCLDQAVQETGGYWEAPNHPDFAVIDSCVRTGHVRALAGADAIRWPAQKASLRLKITPFCGLHLYTSDGQKIRTRSRPRNAKTGLPMRAPKDGYARPLWGHDPSAQPYEISVLLDIDLGTKTLYRASLAAIDWGVDDKGREIYYEEEILPPATGFNESETEGPDAPESGFGSPLDDFTDLLGNGEEVGPDPA